MFFRGITGKSDLILEGKGLKAKLTNSAPGTIICLIGVGLIIFSLHSSSVTREEKGLSGARILDVWAANSYKVTESMDVEHVIDTIVGKGENVRFVNTEITLEKPATLGEIAQHELDGAKYWHILAAINKDRHYYVLSEATQQTQLPGNSLVQIWSVSKYNGLDTNTRIQVSAVSRARGYDELLDLANSGRPFPQIFSESLFRHFRNEELDLGLQYVTPGDARNLREVSLKLYGNSKYWPVLVWANPGQFPKGVDGDTPVSSEQKLSAPQFSPWPR